MSKLAHSNSETMAIIEAQAEDLQEPVDHGQAAGIEPTEADIGRKVVYRRPYCKIEEGFITSFNEKYVFVRYGMGSTSQATERQDLEFIG